MSEAVESTDTSALLRGAGRYESAVKRLPYCLQGWLYCVGVRCARVGFKFFFRPRAESLWQVQRNGPPCSAPAPWTGSLAARWLNPVRSSMGVLPFFERFRSLLSLHAGADPFKPKSFPGLSYFCFD